MAGDNIIHNKEGTMNADTTNSRGYILIKLLHQYIGSSQDSQSIKNAIDCAYNECLQALSLPDEIIEWLNRTVQQEPSNLDRVTLTLSGREYEYFITIKETIALIFLAMQDNNAWEEEFSDLTSRLNNFKQNIIILYREGRCHQGERNDLVNSLYGYKGIQLVLDKHDLFVSSIYTYLDSMDK